MAVRLSDWFIFQALTSSMLLSVGVTMAFPGRRCSHVTCSVSGVNGLYRQTRVLNGVLSPPGNLFFIFLAPKCIPYLVHKGAMRENGGAER